MFEDRIKIKSVKTNKNHLFPSTDTIPYTFTDGTVTVFVITIKILR
jgi:hypothetical protein